jgi:PPM family protein phosphatase
VNELLKSGKLSAEEAESHPQRSVITRAVGTDPDVDVDSFTVHTQNGDVFLICSDGLTDMVDDRAILDAVERHRDNLDRLTKQLVSAANRGGGEDNITVVAFSIGELVGGDDGDTATMQAVTLPVDDDTTEDVGVRASNEAVLAGPSAVRVRVVLATLIVLALLVSLLLWGLMR